MPARDLSTAWAPRGREARAASQLVLTANPWIGQVQRRGRFPRRLTNPCDEPLRGGGAGIEATRGRLVYSATNAMTREQYALPIVQSEPGTVRAR
jgi:hypothetical protein